MESDLAQERQEAHALLGKLSDEKLNAVRILMEVMVDPLSRALAFAPIEDDEITSEMAGTLERSRASLARGEGISHEEILQEFGLSDRGCIGKDPSNLVSRGPIRPASQIIASSLFSRTRTQSKSPLSVIAAMLIADPPYLC